MALRLYGDGNIENVTSINTSVSSTELGYLDGVTSALQTQFSSKQNTTKYCEAGHSAALNAANGTEFSIPLNTIYRNVGGFSGSSGSIILPETGVYEINILFESSISSSTHFIRAANIVAKINGAAIGTNGARYFNTPKTFSNTHYTYHDFRIIGANVGDLFSLSGYLYHDKGSNVTENYSITAYIKLL